MPNVIEAARQAGSLIMDASERMVDIVLALRQHGMLAWDWDHEAEPELDRNKVRDFVGLTMAIAHDKQFNLMAERVDGTEASEEDIQRAQSGRLLIESMMDACEGYEPDTDEDPRWFRWEGHKHAKR